MNNRLLSHKIFKLAITFNLVVSSFVFAPSVTFANISLKTTILPLPDIKETVADQPNNESISDKSQDSSWQEHTVKIGKNDSLSTALDKVKINASTTYNIGHLKNSNLITNLRVGDKLKIWVDKNDILQKILYPKSRTLAYEVIKTDDGYKIHEKKAKVEIRTETAFATINGPFYLSARRAGLSARSIMNITDMFAWNIDFARELRKGDTLKVIYETRYLNGEYLGDGNILAAQITTNHGKDIHNAFVLRDKKGVIGFYDEKGNNLKKAFLKAPVDHVRVTSKFTHRRYHPILKIWRPHLGVDFGGHLNTPIHVTGNGKIIARNQSHGYGKYIKVQHAGKYMTVYGHLNKFGKYKKGQFVKQGDIIGYMGKTGLATGVHLHYEFRINGKQVDPLKVKFPPALPVAKKYKNTFNRKSHFLLTQLNRLNTKTQIVRNFE